MKRELSINDTPTEELIGMFVDIIITLSKQTRYIIKEKNNAKV